MTKQDVEQADEAELNDILSDEEVDLGIEKVAWRRDLAWHLNDGNISFDAKIKDEKFWKSVEDGEAFFNGDRMRVHLQTTARRTRRGVLQIERVIPAVLRIEHAGRKQMRLFERGTD